MDQGGDKTLPSILLKIDKRITNPGTSDKKRLQMEIANEILF
jgi:hypothetical protein